MRRLPIIISVSLLAFPGAARPAAGGSPVKVFVLAGQSNMEGHGLIAADSTRNNGRGSLEYLVKNPTTAPRFAHLIDEQGKWRVRDDVWVAYLHRKGPLTVGYGARDNRIGPELGFGWVVGDAIKAPVLMVKCAWGGKSLAVDFRPSSSGRLPYLLNQNAQAVIDSDPDTVGRYYREVCKIVHSAVRDIRELVPGSNGSFEIAGFGWHQGWNDRIDDNFNAEYEKNLANFIRDIRIDLKSPRLPFVIAETGMGGPHEAHPRALALMRAQAAVAEYPEFKGNVAFVATKRFWRGKEESPGAQGYHWNSNAETYYLIGEAMGNAMAEMITGRRADSVPH